MDEGGATDKARNESPEAEQNLTGLTPQLNYILMLVTGMQELSPL